MKKILLVCVLAMCALTSSAQFMNSSQGVRKSSGVQSNEAPRVINSVKFTYSPMTMDGGNFFEDKDEMELNGLSLAWTQSRAILQNLPLYVEYGLGLQYSFKTDSQKIGDEYDSYNYKFSLNALSIKVPVGIMYRLQIPQTGVAIMPYAGFDFGCYALGKYKVEVSYEGETDEEEVDMFNEEEVGANRFICDWHIGAKLAFNKFFVGVAYEGPIAKLYDEEIEIKMSQVNISVGINF